METQRETRRRGSRGAGPMGPMPVRRRSARHLAEVPEKQTNVVFDPSDPYSAAMDDMPLKDLFPNMKVRKRSQGKKVEASEVPSPKNTESEESVRSKLRDSLAAALKRIDSAEWEHDRGQEFKVENEKGEQADTDQKPAKVGEETAKEQVLSSEEGVALEEKAGADLKEHVNKLESTRDDRNLLKEENVDFADIDEAPSKRIKLEVESIKAEDGTNHNEASESAEKVAFDIEAELHRHFGGVNRKYKEKARSLLFNLKDRSNPELRSRVLAGEITPENLCNMNAEQLASKELSEWRMAKAEEFAHMVVLTDTDAEQPRLVKKTHKGEIEVEVEKDDVLTEVVTTVSQQRFALATQQETEETSANAVSGPAIADEEIDEELVEAEAEADAEGLEFSPIRELNLTDGISAASDQVHDITMQETGEELDAALQEEENASLPAILSLDEFVGSKKVKVPKASVKGDELDLKLGLNEIKSQVNITQVDTVISPSQTSVKDRVPRKSVVSPNHKPLESGSTKNGTVSQKEKRKEHRLNEKLWEGSFQLSGCQISPVVALFKSGDGVELQSWPKLIEIKGRVRLDALEKFLQELRLSRTRAVMIIACRVGEGAAERGPSVNALKEAANQYQRGERVGYAEPVPGYELYLFPGGGSSLKLLVEHGYLNADQISAAEEGVLIGFVVCRRSTIPTNASHKSSSHYFSANRHALSAQLDSPTRPSEIQCTGNVVATSKTPSLPKESENKSASLSFVNLQGSVSGPNNSAEGGVLNTASKSKSMNLQQMARSPAEPNSFFPQAPQDLRSGKVRPDWLRKEFVKDEDADDDLPPGFGPKALTKARHRNIEDDDDDLPEYDFSAQNSARIFTSIKAPDVGSSLTPFSITSFPQGSRFPPLPQGSVGGFSSQTKTSAPFEQLNHSGQHSSQFPRPIVSHVGGPSEQVRPLVPSSSQVSQPLPFHAMGPRPPPGPPPGPPPFGAFPSRPLLPADGSFATRMPSAAQTPVPNVHAEQKDVFAGSFNQLSQNRPSLPQAYDDQRTRATIPLSQSLPVPISQTTSGPGQRRGGNQGSSLWDDDDMPEWCPPTVAQQSEGRQIPPRHPVLPSAESGPMSVPPRGMAPPLVGGGWQGMPLPPAVPLQGEGRGILQAPPAMRYPGPPSGGHFPIARPEKFSMDRGPSIRPNEPRGFKGGK